MERMREKDWKDVARWLLGLGANPHEARRVILSSLPGRSPVLERRVMALWESLPQEVRERNQEAFAALLREVLG